MGVVALEEFTFETVTEEMVVENVIKHCVEVKVGVVMESAVSLGAEEGVEIKRTSLLASSLCSEPVVLFAFVSIRQNIVSCTIYVV
jgi:hypothetical protein